MRLLRHLTASLKFRIVALSMVTGIAAAGGASWMVLRATQVELQRQLLASAATEREHTAALLSSKLEMVRGALVAAARQVSPAALRDSDPMADFLLSQPALASLFDNLAAVASDGAVTAYVERGKPVAGPANIADRSAFQRVMRGDQPVVSEPVVGRVSKVPLVLVMAPVLGADGQAQGALIGGVRLQSNGLFAETGGTREGAARDLVIDRAGVLLTHPDKSRIMGSATTEPGLEAIFARWHDMGSPIETRATAELGADHLVSMAGIPLSDWALVRVTPNAVALAPLQAARRAAVLAALLAGLVSSLLAGAAAWALARPIGRLRDLAERMLDSDTAPALAWPAQSGEIGAMSRAFQLLLQTRDAQGASMQALMLQLQAVLDNAEVGLALSRDGRFEMVSRQFCTTLGYEGEQLVGQPTRIVHLPGKAYEEFSAAATPAFMQQGFYDCEVQLQRRNGQTFWSRMRGRAVLPGDRSKGTIWVVTDIGAEKDQRERLTYAASHDRLTGLVNRASFEAQLEEATARAAQAPFCALFIDLDRFKQVNDTGGHAAGDALLRGVAAQLVATLRKSDTVARLGGDEFAILLPQCPMPRARALAEKLRAAVEAYRLEWEGRSHAVGASIGVVAVNGMHANAAEVLRAADTACYEAKRAGRNQVALAPA